MLPAEIRGEKDWNLNLKSKSKTGSGIFNMNVNQELAVNLKLGFEKYHNLCMKVLSPDEKFTKEVEFAVLKNVIDKLLTISTKTFAYQDYGKLGDVSHFPPIEKTMKGKYLLDKCSRSSTDYPIFWKGDDYSDIRGTILFHIDNVDDVGAVVRELCDPTVIENANSLANKSAVNFAKKKISREKCFCVNSWWRA